MSKEDVDRNVDNLKPEMKDFVQKIYSNIIVYNRLPMELFEGKRTMERQEWLFKQGYSKTTNSRHLDGSAVDFVWYDETEKKWSWDNNILHYFNFLGGRVLELYGDRIVWGGSWTWLDLAHFELRP